MSPPAANCHYKRKALPVGILIVFGLAAARAEYRAPAGEKPAMRRPGAASILPGGRVIVPVGRQYVTGAGPFGIAISPDGKRVATPNGGPNRYSVSVIEKSGDRWRAKEYVASGDAQGDSGGDDWHSVFMGLAFEDNGTFWVSEGNSGRVRALNPSNGETREVIDLNRDGFQNSYSGGLAIDRERRRLYVVDQANDRVAVIDLSKKRILASVRVGRLPFAIALAPDGNRVYVTNPGMLEYRPLPGVDPKRIRDTGLPFPAFGFPSPEAASGVRRETPGGAIEVPPLGDPNSGQSNSVAVINVSGPGPPAVEKFVRTGLAFGEHSQGGSSPSGILATTDRVYVSNAHNDSVSVLNARTLELETEIRIRIPTLEYLRGVLPIGLAYHEASGWLLVAEAGMNAVGIIDTRQNKLIGHLPVGWFPTAIAIREDDLYVTNIKGHGTGPNATEQRAFRQSFQGSLRRGTLTIAPLPGTDELAKHTGLVYDANGFLPRKEAAKALPEAIRYVVLIVKENRTFDEVLGDITTASNGSVAGAPLLARFGEHGIIYPDYGSKRPRLGLRNINVTPNHHAIARRWSFSDNFYASSEVDADGHHWLVGAYPNAWTESSLRAVHGGQSRRSVHPEGQPEAGILWHHLERNGISFRNFGEGLELAGVDQGPGLRPTGARYLTNVPLPDPLYRNTSREYPQYNMNIPDQYRATRFIEEIERDFVKAGKELPRFLFLHLPNDHMANPRPEDGYPFEASYVADNDYALGRILEYLSKTPWWKQMAVFITEDDAQGGVDHIDSHRTLLLVASPYARKNYVSHVNTSFPGLLKTIFRLLGMPPLNLFDAVASDLADCFTDEVDFAAYEAVPIARKDLFDPERAREPAER
ncbi:MAG TPA: alkaline phosphatase family protein [Bryobacteraceae bacterium]|nr:alkaline phosphatase family protein [Bryobacteraceae bacterium]